MNLHCQECEKCCCGIMDYIHLTHEEYMRLNKIEPLKAKSIGHMHFLRSPCQFYDAEKKMCRVYDQRPMICIIFPFTEIIRNGNWYFVISPECWYVKKVWTETMPIGELLAKTEIDTQEVSDILGLNIWNMMHVARDMKTLSPKHQHEVQQHYETIDKRVHNAGHFLNHPVVKTLPLQTYLAICKGLIQKDEEKRKGEKK